METQLKGKNVKKTFIFNVAQYIRLSREDGDKAESDSIGNQRKLIHSFLEGKEEFVLYDSYEDDGYTGTNFKRPGFLRMIHDIEEGNVNCVIVKDLSRFGRDYIDTGKYLERYFPEHDVRFISISDNIDSMKQAYDMLMPIKNIFNEQYARDISKKVHTAMHSKQKAGEFIGAFPSYGYKKSVFDKNKLVVDEYAAEVVRRIFSLYIAGTGKIRIASILNEEGIACPSEYKRLNGENYRNSKQLASTTYWTYSTIHRILENQIYIGDMVQGKTVRRMRGRARTVDKEEWIIKEGTHEPIIDEMTWNKTQYLLGKRTRELDLNSNVSIFAGFLKCGDCGRAMTKKYAKSGTGGNNVNYYCGSYVRSGRQFCSPHHIRHQVLEDIVLNDLKMVVQSIENLSELVQKQTITKNRITKNFIEDKKLLETELEKVQNQKKTFISIIRMN